IFVEKEVVEEVFDKRTEVDLENARFFVPEAQIGDMVMVELEGATTKKFGRIAAQTAKQVILQRIREAERSTLYEEFMEREGDVVVGTVQSVNPNMVTLSLGRAEAIMPRNQQIPNERYKPHEKIRVYIVEVKKHSRGPQIVVSRSHRNMLRRLLEYEVPEIYNGQVEIKSIAREAGYRSKVAVAALQEGIDPVGACVGMKGVRIQNIVKELHEEKIDVIEWKPKQEEFIAAALSPAHVKGVYLEDDIDSGRTAIVIVPDDELSLAIGKEGANARLAAKLTGWRIDIKSVSEAVMEALDDQTTSALVEFKAQNPDMVAEVRRIMDKIAAKRVVMPEEFTYLARFADQAQRRIMQVREQARQKRLAEINAVKATLPAGAFAMPVEDLPV
ncbi:MAG: transcription termination factor NusA, partial [Anaerolinea sp.]|nr:transcription termination factor NusA [Anaerolinea sp.]